jgi:tetratricopeptide (TPR) repeat protein
MRYVSVIIGVAIFFAFTMTAFAADDTTSKEKSVQTAKYTGLSHEYQQMFNEATSQFEAKNYDEAIVLLTKVINANPDYIPAYKTRGLAFMEKGKFTKSNIAKVDPTVRYTKAIYEYQKAIRNFTKIIQLDPKIDYAYFYRAVSDIELYYYALPAIEDLNIYINDFNNETVEAYYQRGCAYLQRGALPAAEADFKKVIEMDSNYADAYAGIMRAYETDEKYNSAINYFGTLIDRYPTNALPRYHRGLIYMLQEDYTKAIADFDKALALFPDYTDARDMRKEAIRDSNL